MFADVYKLLKVYMATCGFTSLAPASIVINIMNGGTKLLSFSNYTSRIITCSSKLALVEEVDP